MKAILTDDAARVMQDPTSESISMTSLHKGDEFEVGKVIRKRKEVWVEAILPTGVTGYIGGDTKIFAIKRVEATGNALDVYESPDANSKIITSIPKRTQFTVRGYEKVNDVEWYSIDDSAGVKGYIRSGVRLRMVPEVTKASARKMMITGGLFAVAGALIYFFTKPGTSVSGDTSFLTIGLLLLGLFQVGQGYIQYRQISKKENKE